MIYLIKKPLLWMIISLFIILNILLVIEQQRTAIFKIPIAIEDRDQTESSEKWIEAIRKSPAIQVEIVDGKFMSAEDIVSNNEASVGVVVPKGFEGKLIQNNTKNSVELYQANGLVAAIATETISEALYEQQLPFIIYKYTENKAELTQVQKKYDLNQPENQLKKEVAQGNEENGNYQTVLIMVSTMLILMSQIFIFKNIRQFHTLRRIQTYAYAEWKLLLIYFMTLLMSAVILTVIISVIWELPISFFQSFIWLGVYQVVASVIVFKVQTTSHAVFMLGAWSICLSAFYIISQLLGGIG